jgi:hypothetical protein
MPQPAPRASVEPARSMPRDTIHIDQLRAGVTADVTRTADAVPVAHEVVHRVESAIYRSSSAPITLPTVAREFRGVWIATVHNMDWPSSRSRS